MSTKIFILHTIGEWIKYLTRTAQFNELLSDEEKFDLLSWTQGGCGIFAHALILALQMMGIHNAIIMVLVNRSTSLIEHFVVEIPAIYCGNGTTPCYLDGKGQYALFRLVNKYNGLIQEGVTLVPWNPSTQNFGIIICPTSSVNKLAQLLFFYFSHPFAVIYAILDSGAEGYELWTWSPDQSEFYLDGLRIDENKISLDLKNTFRLNSHHKMYISQIEED